MNKLKSIYFHTKNKKFYNVIGIGRSIENPYKQIVVYQQLYQSNLKNTNILLPKGSIWTREYTDFNQKFIKVHFINWE